MKRVMGMDAVRSVQSHRHLASALTSPSTPFLHILSSETRW